MFIVRHFCSIGWYGASGREDQSGQGYTAGINLSQRSNFSILIAGLAIATAIISGVGKDCSARTTWFFLNEIYLEKKKRKVEKKNREENVGYMVIIFNNKIFCFNNYLYI